MSDTVMSRSIEEIVRALRPLHDQIFIRQDAPSGMLSERIVAADKHKPWPPQGTVLAVGPGRVGDDGERIPMSVQSGDRVLFERRGGCEVEALRIGDSIRFLILRDEDISAVLDGEGPEPVITELRPDPRRMHRADTFFGGE